MTKSEVSKSLNLWYSRDKRTLPFRLSRDPYKIWLSEVMLQQTQIITMLPYYKSWIKKYPTIKSVIEVPYSVLLKDWEGLGYYRRCLHFYKALKIIESKYFGKVPKDYIEFRQLPGVGDYTAAAVLSIAYNRKHVLIDGNVKRVFSRYLAIKVLSKYNLSRIKNKLKSLMADSNPGVFNQSVMELGAIICKKYNPKCVICPLSSNCKGFITGKTFNYPRALKRKKKPVINYIGLIILFKNKILIRKRKERLLKDLWEFPILEKNKIQLNQEPVKITSDSESIFSDLETIVKNKKVKRSGIINHTFSHLTFRISFFEYNSDKLFKVEKNMKWVTRLDLDSLPCTRILYKALSLIQT